MCGPTPSPSQPSDSQIRSWFRSGFAHAHQFGESVAYAERRLRRANHASIIDGIRLSKSSRHRYRNRDMADLERCLQKAADARYRLVVTDGVFSMDGYIAPLDEICALAQRYDAMVMVDDSHRPRFRERMSEAAFDILPGEHPITPVMIDDTSLAARMAQALPTKGIYVVAFSSSVVPKEKARILVQLSASPTTEEVDRAVRAFSEARCEVGAA